MSFDADSRYKNAGTRVVIGPDGDPVTVVAAAPFVVEGIEGWHLKMQGQRLDQIAYKYLRASTQWWRVALRNDAMWPDSVVDANELAIPPRKRSD